MYIETERLILRDFVTEDIAEAARYLGDFEVMEFIEEPFDEKKTEEFIHSYGIGTNPKIYALVEKKTNKLTGHVIFGPVHHEKIYEMGWIIGRDFQKKGYAFEIGIELIKYCFGNLYLHKIIAQTIGENSSSIKLMERLGMKREGCYREQIFHKGKWRDEVVYGILENGVCPICKEPNHCAFATGKDPSTCWCMTTTVPEGLLDQMPKQQLGRSCVCKNCIEKLKKKLRI